MLHLRRCILTRLLSSPTTSISPLHCLLSAAAPAISPGPRFAVDEYLIDTCGLTRDQALKASGKISHLNSPTKPDAVLAFLAGLGLSSADVVALVAKDPLFLCVNVEKTLSPIVAGLSRHGISHAEIAHLLSQGRVIYSCRSVVSKLPYYISLLGSIENCVRLFKQRKGPSLLNSSLEKVVKPNVAFLRKCGLGDCVISKLCLSAPRVVSVNPERIQAVVASAEGLGVPRGSAMFLHMLDAIAFLSEEKIVVRMEYLKSTFRWSDAEVRIAICTAPNLLRRSHESMQRKSEFLISEMGLVPAYIACRPTMINYSLEGWLRPRYYVLKFLKENGLLKRDSGYYTVVKLTEKVFVEKFICPYKEAVPHLSEDYAAACRGEVPTSFRFT